MKHFCSAVLAAAILLVAGVGHAGVDPAIKCNVSKDNIVGAYYACHQKADALAAMKNTSADYTKCAAVFEKKWEAAETAGQDSCPDHMAAPAQMENYIASQATETAALVAGTGTVPVCGDGSINAAGEHCDGASLDGLTCASFGRYGTLACTSGCDFDLGGCQACPNGTIDYQGKCWVLGALGAGCDGACTTLGLTYDTATLTMTGSQGSDANCLAVLDATGAAGDILNNAGGSCVTLAAGCAVLPDYGVRARCGTPATTSTASASDTRRVCACH